MSTSIFLLSKRTAARVTVLVLLVLLSLALSVEGIQPIHSRVSAGGPRRSPYRGRSAHRARLGRDRPHQPRHDSLRLTQHRRSAPELGVSARSTPRLTRLC